MGMTDLTITLAIGRVKGPEGYWCEREQRPRSGL